jgi:hypothetical protein
VSVVRKGSLGDGPNSSPQTPVEKFKTRMKLTLRSASSGDNSVDSSSLTNSPKSTTSTVSGMRGLGLAASAKILTKAANWKAKSIEKLHAKNERRERRATKTLAIVLGTTTIILQELQPTACTVAVKGIDGNNAKRQRWCEIHAIFAFLIIYMKKPYNSLKLCHSIIHILIF